MMTYWRSFYSELIKLKRQPLVWVHLLVPLAGIAIFLGYYGYTPFSPESKLSAYMQVLAIAFPTMIGIVCGIAADQEASAGQYQQLLVSPNRLASLAAKLTLLLLLGYCSSLLAAGGFGVGFNYLLKQSIVGLGFYAQAASVLFGSCLFLYFLHLFISLRLGKGASIGLGIVESLIGALLLTGLGDRIWIYFPSAWPIRILTIWMQYGIEGRGTIPAELLLWPGILWCTGATAISMIILGYWYGRWEGAQSVE
ncbi:lantibiotic ABC transporter permease [Paenibacillus antibioticophila]|uniref:Lantibiotic ABC transporter permease n=1 Tax=Paenibacillus antibioticophila TaxID=1274374 RepID=A0A919XLW9_9BACL|nr:lantibiotic immunity ABC transporter MutG family permease subunit [Paenibacillus antibioticophila]GIO35417.1 lantibiotic ABC transporter permease [Paenibacillus antibioticophila]